METKKRHGAQPISDILSELVSRRGFARLRSQQHVEDAWNKAIGEPGSKYTRLGAVRRGVMEILVANSVLLQELAGFHKQPLLRKLQDLLGPSAVRDLRFRLDQAA